MTENNEKDKKIEQEIDALFSFIGRFIIIFQWMETKLDQIILLDRGHDNWSKTQAQLARMTVDEKIKKVKSAFRDGTNFVAAHDRLEWVEKFYRVISKVDEQRERRNSLLHSSYLFEFMELGDPPLRSRRTKVEGECHFDREYLSNDKMNNMLQELLETSIEMSMTHVQLIHYYRLAERKKHHPREKIHSGDETV